MGACRRTTTCHGPDALSHAALHSQAVKVFRPGRGRVEIGSETDMDPREYAVGDVMPDADSSDTQLHWINWRNALVLAVMAVVIFIFWLTRPPPPPNSSVNGAYKNPCCRAIVLRNGSALIEHRFSKYTLVRDKFWGQ